VIAANDTAASLIGRAEHHLESLSESMADALVTA
jgi:hypothetical protein